MGLAAKIITAVVALGALFYIFKNPKSSAQIITNTGKAFAVADESLLGQQPVKST